jgi:hypothetical protein
MIYRTILAPIGWLVTALAGAISSAQTPTGTAISYQGELRQSGSPVNGSADLRFRLYTASGAGIQVGPQVTVNNASLTAGRFAATLDFGAAAFGPDARWLEIDVRSPAGSGTFVTLAPRQRIIPAPVAQFAMAPWSLNGTSVYYSAGNVGLGTTTPQERLHVFGNVTARGLLSSNNPADPTSVVFLGWGTDAGGTAMAKLRVGGDGPGATNGLDIQRTGDRSLMRLLHTGEVGIGTSAPAARLHVLATSGAAARFEDGQVRIVNGQLVVDGPYGGGPAEHAASIYTQTQGWGLSVTNVGSGRAISAGTSGAGTAVEASVSAAPIAVRATNNSTSGSAYGLFAQSQSPTGIGAFGQGKYGLYGFSSVGGFDSKGVHGVSNTPDGVGVHGHASGSGAGAAGVYGTASSGGWAGVFGGPVQITGNLHVSGSKNFLIDNPANPENEYLIHSSVESDEMKNIYDGVVTLDAGGEATVELPDWFDDLNGDFRYQLTCVGGFAPVYVRSEIEENRFTIAGGVAGLKVSWQVTGVRIDPAARRLRTPAVVPKSESERGRYLDAAAYGQPESRQIERIAHLTARHGPAFPGEQPEPSRPITALPTGVHP